MTKQQDKFSTQQRFAELRFYGCVVLRLSGDLRGLFVISVKPNNHITA